MLPVRVLLVEDNPADVVLVREVLERNGSVVDLVTAQDGTEALARLRNAAAGNEPMPTLAILDLNIPGLSGHDVLARIRAEDALRALPVIILTTSAADRDIKGAYGAGANAYVTKPLQLDAFEAALKQLERFWFGVARLPDGGTAR